MFFAQPLSKKKNVFWMMHGEQKPYKPYTTLHHHKPHDKKQPVKNLWSRLW